MRFAPCSTRTRPRTWVVFAVVALMGSSSCRGWSFRRACRTAAVRHLCAGSVAGGALAVLAAVLDETEDAEPAVDLERVERDLGREEGPLLGAAGELDRGGPPVSQDAFEQLAQLGQLGRVDARDRRLEQLCARVAEERAAGVVGGEDAVVLGGP